MLFRTLLSFSLWFSPRFMTRSHLMLQIRAIYKEPTKKSLKQIDEVASVHCRFSTTSHGHEMISESACWHRKCVRKYIHLKNRKDAQT